jgi:hypothetical protein
MARRTAPEEDLTRFLLATWLSFVQREGGATRVFQWFGELGVALDAPGGKGGRGVGSTTEHCSKVGEEFGSDGIGN